MKRGYDVPHILEYIHEQPASRITVEGLAELPAYSFYRFCHAFSSDTGAPVATYLRRRKMDFEYYLQDATSIYVPIAHIS